jgi:hypothetical protein
LWNVVRIVLVVVLEQRKRKTPASLLKLLSDRAIPGKYSALSRWNRNLCVFFYCSASEAGQENKCGNGSDDTKDEQSNLTSSFVKVAGGQGFQAGLTGASQMTEKHDAGQTAEDCRPKIGLEPNSSETIEVIRKTEWDWTQAQKSDHLPALFFDREIDRPKRRVSSEPLGDILPQKRPRNEKTQ